MQMIRLILTIVLSTLAFVSMGANDCTDVVLHEWDTDEPRMPKLIKDETGREEYDGTEKPEGLVTWVNDGTSFTPVAKVTDGERYTIVHDYLGTPTQAYDSKGELVWEMLLDVYGRVAECHGDRTLVPFRYQGQYEDEDTGLYYNRFRYYSPDMGMYISSDPIGLAGNNPTLYGYVEDVNLLNDILGLSKYVIINVLGRKVYQNTTDFVTGVPDFVDSSVHPSIRAKIQAGATNLDLMKAGNAPIGFDGKPINLHHILGQESGAMVELAQTTHQKYSKNYMV